MKNSLNISVTGYYATGSSAVIDLLKEYEDVHVAAPVDGDYEHTTFYCNGGVFDLGNILLNNCSPYNSDSAIYNFLKSAKRLNNNDFGWFGSFRKYFGDDRYLDIANAFVNEICTIKDRKGSNHAERVNFSFMKALLQVGAKIAIGRAIPKLGRNYHYDSDKVYFSMPTHEEFVCAAKKYTSNYMDLFCDYKTDGKVNLFDHLIWPHHTKIINEYFDKNFKVIVVNRDPRDVYILNKYFLHRPPVSLAKPYFPIEPEGFIDEWKRTVCQLDNNDRILSIRFEDLVYNYADTVKTIEVFCHIQDENHVRKYDFFNPERSIENTQTFLVKKEWEEEVALIKEELAEDCYVFPNRREPNQDKWFDTQDNISRKARK